MPIPPLQLFVGVLSAVGSKTHLLVISKRVKRSKGSHLMVARLAPRKRFANVFGEALFSRVRLCLLSR
jgi:hypothetical protein